MTRCLIEVASFGRPNVTRTYIVNDDPATSRLPAEARERLDAAFQPLRDALADAHPEWDDHHVNCALFAIVSDFIEDHAAYERVCEQKGLLPL